jgi:hypothetical protein
MSTHDPIDPTDKKTFRSQHEHAHLTLIDDVNRALDDLAAGRVKDARKALQTLRTRRCAK